MPWSLKQNYRDCSGWAVVKDSDGSIAGCHGSDRGKAVRQIAALEASEDKARDVVEKERYTYNGVSVEATGRRSSDRSDKKYMRTVTHDGSERTVHYGDPDMQMRRTNDEARSNFLSRHNCDSKKDPFAPGFWACYDWARTDEKEKDIMSEEQRDANRPDETIAMNAQTHAAIAQRDQEDDGQEAKERHDKMHGDMEASYYPYYGVTSFEELDEIQQSEKMTYRVEELTRQFRAMVDNIMADGEVEDKASAVRSLTEQYVERVEMAQSNAEMKEKGLIARIKSALGKDEPAPEQPERGNSIMFWKEADGRYRWFATYSNNYRDDDTPPEIISEKSHKTFVDLVDKGIAPYPELWHWHVPGTRWGEADWVAYADGFALASGYVDEGHEKEADALMESGIPLRASHGMPKQFIQRNEKDKSIIDFHITTEISPLPAPAAANRLTDFELLKENDMALPEKKRQYLKEHVGLSDDVIDNIERGLASKQKQAQEDGLEFKQTETVEADTSEADDGGDAEQPEAEQPEAGDVKPGDVVSRQEVAESLGEIVSGFTQSMNEMTEQISALSAEVKELKKDDEEKIAEKAANTPPASLSALIRQSVVGNESTKVDGRTSLAKDGPQETEAKGKKNGLFFEDWMGGDVQQIQ